MDVHSESLQEVRTTSFLCLLLLLLVVAHRRAQLLASLRQCSARARAHCLPTASPPVLPALHRGDVIEIQGPAASGKTHLLYHILLSFLVSPDADAEEQIAAVVYDTDTSFDIQRFRHLLLSRISRLPSRTLDPHESVRRSLARLHVFRPTSLTQLAASIANLPAHHSSHMLNQEIAVLAIDSISSFYWPDRFSAEQLRNFAPEKAKAPPLHHVCSAIQSVRRSHAPLVVLTNWALHSAPSHSRSLYTQHLHPFPALEDAIAGLGATVFSSPFRLTHHIALSSPSSDSSSAALLDDASFHGTRHRKEITDNRQPSCLIKSSGTLDTVRFALQITDDDILIQSHELVL